MQNIFLSLFIGTLLFSGPVQAQSRNPFAKLLPKPEEIIVEESAGEEPETPEAAALPAGLVLQGVFWGVKKPQAIINDRVYGEKERLKDTDIEIIKIEKGAVHLLYRKRVFILRPSAKIP